MRKVLAVFLIVLLLPGTLIFSAMADNAPLPYTQTDQNGDYTDLPDSGSAANGTLLLDDELAAVYVLRTLYSRETPDYFIELLIENKSNETFYISGSDLAIVDGYSFPSCAFEEIPAGQLKIERFTIHAEDFYVPEISTPREIKFNIAFLSSPENTPDTLLDVAYFTIYPLESPENEIEYKPISDIGYSSDFYYNDESECGYRIIDAKLQENSNFYQIDILIENNSNECREFSWRNVTADEQSANVYWSVIVPARSNTVTHIYIDTLPLILADKGGPSVIEFDFISDNMAGKSFSEHIVFCPARG